ncbi:MAG: hypothetical protein KBT04_01350 [Bacteroidales bacterium]|nr:hypothetical protein [Candidatus Colimorpha onthohippi]
MYVAIQNANIHFSGDISLINIHFSGDDFWYATHFLGDKFVCLLHFFGDIVTDAKSRHEFFSLIITYRSEQNFLPEHIANEDFAVSYTKVIRKKASGIGRSSSGIYDKFQ